MPITIGDYQYDLVNGVDLTKPIRTSKPAKQYPVASDPSLYYVKEEYMVLTDYYEPLVPTKRHSTIANLYWLTDSDLRDVGVGVSAFTRTWITIPGMDASGKKRAYVRSEYESYVMNCPGMKVDAAAFLQYPVSGYSVGSGKHTITTSTPHDVSVGKGCIIYYQVKDPLNKLNYLRQAYRIALTGTTGTTLVVDQIVDVNTVQPIGIQRANISTPSYQKTVTSRIDYTYYLPGVDVASEDDIEIIEQFFIVDNTTGARTDLLGDLTTPSLDEYNAKIAAKEWFPVECIVEGWPDKDSSIMQRSVRYVRYQH